MFMKTDKMVLESRYRGACINNKGGLARWTFACGVEEGKAICLAFI